MPSRLCFIHRVKGEKRQSHSACSQPLFVFALFDVSLQVRNVWVLFVCEKSKHSMQLVSVIICVLFQSSGYRGWNPKPGCRRGMENLIMSPLSISLQLSSNRLVVLSGCECVGPYEDETERSVHAQ